MRLRGHVHRPQSLVDPRILAAVFQRLVLFNLYGWS
jgi:hypothetical protein